MNSFDLDFINRRNYFHVTITLMIVFKIDSFDNNSPNKN